MGGEDLEGGEFPEIAPEIAVGRPGEAGEAVAEVLAGEEAGAVGENDVVFGETLLRRGGGGDDEDAAESEAEEEDGAVALGESGEGAVEGLFEEVEVTDDRKSREGGGREVS